MEHDHNLVRRHKEGDRKATEELIRMYQGVVFGVIFKIYPNKAICEELTQDAFIRAFDKIDQFQERSTFKSWLIRIAINLTKNYLTSYGFRNVKPVEDFNRVKDQAGESHELTVAHKKLGQSLQALVRDLPHKQRTAVMLRIYEDMSFSEIAETMDCPFDTAKANYRHGIQSLKKNLFKHNKELAHELLESLDIFN
jgi:RNA polymerase sigma-70 factor, ECF subfamily